MHEGGDLQAHVNTFNNTLANLTGIDVIDDDKDKTIILLCYIPSSYDHLVTCLTNEKESITLDSISSTLLQYAQCR